MSYIYDISSRRVNSQCSGVLQCSDGLSNKVPYIIRRLMDNIKLLLICILRVLLPQSLIFFRIYFFISLYMVLFLFNNVIYLFLLLWLYVYVWLPWLRFFPCFFLSCKANAMVKPAKTGHGPHSSKFLWCSMYCLFCVLLFIVCVYMCTELLPPSGYPIAVNKYIIYHTMSY